MSFLRSLFFNIFFYGWLITLLLTSWILMPFNRKVMRQGLKLWSRTAILVIKYCCGIDYRFVGLDKLPEGPIVIACKHQSTWETFALYLILEDPQYILKQELMDIPLWGWYAGKSQHIAVDRDAGSKALRQMVAETVDRVNLGRQVIIFPEGTRSEPGKSGRYHPGVAAIYKALPEHVPMVPMALNSGKYWGRRKFWISPGTITLEVLDPIYPGVDRKEFMKLLEERIEEASTRLLAVD